ncbi:endoribonuclease Dicer homolog 3a isoform X1 [Tanacetum coccineum]
MLNVSRVVQQVQLSCARLEFLGDSVLGVLITRYLYSQHKDIEPAELTDLRSASVNNENFASAAVRGNRYPHLQYRSDILHTQIADYVKSVTTSSTDVKKGPKALGDLVESIAGALLVDTRLNLVKIKDEFLVGNRIWIHSRKFARGSMRALSQANVQDNKDAVMDNEKDSDEDTKTTVLGSQQLADRKYVHGCLMKKEFYANHKVAVIESISLQKKGGPRTSLFELCVKKQWPKPTFTLMMLWGICQGVDKKNSSE